jgi:hypothetical protein
MQLTMPKTVLAAAVWPASYTLAQRLLLALNIGTLGFFCGMRAFEDWDGKEPFAAVFERSATRFFSERVRMDRMCKSRRRAGP